MNTAWNDKQENINFILDLIRKYTDGQFSERIHLSDSSNETYMIAKALNALGEQMQAKSDYFLSNQKRIDEVLDVLMSFTMSDFTKRAQISDAGDELDAIALGLNTLAEELDAAKTQEQKYIRELESANKELKSFTYLASHDLKEPLRNLMMFTSIIGNLETKNISEKGKQVFEKISDAAGRLEQLIEDLGTFSRVQSYTEEFKQVDLNLLVKEIKVLYAQSGDSSQIIIESGTLPVVNGLPVQLHQLFSHIIGNSVKYRQANKPVEINIKSEIVPGYEISGDGADKERNYYRICVSDNGIGFDQKYADRIFEIFQRLHGRDKYSGTGMGLALCRKIVKNHYGVIYATGKENSGATFFICLPA